MVTNFLWIWRKGGVAISGGAPHCQPLSIGTKFSDPIVALIHNINRIIRANSYAARTVKSGIGALPFGNKSSVGSQLLHAMIGAVRDVNIAHAVNCYSIRTS